MQHHQIRRRRILLSAILLFAMGSVVVPGAAHADSATTFYVDNAATACSDVTTDSAFTPYCSIQSAVDAATSPGDTVIVSSGTYAPFSVTSSGTAASPITIESSDPKYADYGNMPYIPQPDGTAAGIALSGSYIKLRGFGVTDGSATAPAATVSDAAHDVLDGNDFVDHDGSLGVPLVELGADTSSITLSRNAFSSSGNYGQIGVLGGSDDVITTNGVSGAAPGVVLTGATSVDVTSNTFINSYYAAIEATDGSRSTSIENNLVERLSPYTKTPSSEVALLVDATSISNTTADYNDLSTGDSDIPNVYSWGATPYATAAAFEAATGQGTHDSNAASAPTVDSANFNAPGELTTDSLGNPRVDDPSVADTGAGTYTYYDRGSTETEDRVTSANAASWPTAAPVGATASYTTTLTDMFGYTITGCAFDFGDGTVPVSVTPNAEGACTVQHSYASSGSYTVSLAVTVISGNSFTRYLGAVQANALAPLTPAFLAMAEGPLGVNVTATGTDDWNIVSCTTDFGDGTAHVSEPYNSGCSLNHTYVTVGTRMITVTLTDAGGNQKSVSQAFKTSGSYFSPVTPTRILDTRKGAGVVSAGPVAPYGTVKLKIAGIDGLPLTPDPPIVSGRAGLRRVPRQREMPSGLEE